jgi:PST family polysaccharide transporter
MTPGSASFDIADQPVPEAGLRRAAVAGVAWRGLSYFVGKALVFVSTVVLARLLMPSDFGVVGLALVFIAYIDGATDLGVAEALVYMGRDARREDAAFSLSLLWSGALTGIAFLAAPVVANFFHRPDITTMFRVLSLSLLIGGTGEVPDALLRKALLFRRKMASDLARVLVQGITSIVLAVAGLGPWALVYGYLGGGIVWSAVMWALAGYRPGRAFWRPGWAMVRPLLAYGVPVAGNTILLSLVFDIDYLIIGRRLGARPLGLYTLGFRIPEIAIINVFYVLSAVAFPLFSKARMDPVRLRRGYLTSIRLTTVYGVAAGVSLALVAPMLVTVVFGGKWRGSIVALEGLALYAAFRSLGIGAVDVYKGIGRPRLAFASSLVRLGVLVPSLLFAVRFGIKGVAWAQAIVALVLAVGMQALATRILGISYRRVASALVPAVAVGIGTAVGAGAVRLFVPGPPAMRLALALVLGGGAGLVAIRLAGRGFLREIRSLVRRKGAEVPVP